MENAKLLFTDEFNISVINIVLNILKAVITLYFLYFLDHMLLYDGRIKKIIFGIALLLLYYKAQINQSSARTSALLIKIIIFQIWIIGFIILTRNVANQHLFNKICFHSKLKTESSLQWHYVFGGIILTQIFSAITLAISIFMYPDYYQSLTQFPQLKYMFIPFVFIFIAVAIFDKLFFKNYKNSTRRKTFHFVPVIISPILIIINYKLALLMAIAAFFLFWQMENLRYFGKLARIQMRIITDKNTKQEEKQLITNNKQKNFQERGIDRGIIKLLRKINSKLQTFPLFVWMQQLNSARQSHFYFTHLSLILGLSLTFIFYPCPMVSKIQTQTSYCSFSSPQNISILLRQNMSVFLTIADALAAIIGSKYGKHQISKGNKKTYQGYFGFVVTIVIIQFGIGLLFGDFNNLQYGLIFISSFVCGLAQLFSGDMDNIATGLAYVAVAYIYDQLNI